MKRSTRLLATASAALALLGGTACSSSGDDAGARSSSTTSTVEGLGEPTSSDAEQWLLALTADSASVSQGTVTLTGVSPTVTAFTDRPARSSRPLSTQAVLVGWSTTFGSDAPNAVLSGLVDGAQVDTTVEITSASASGTDGVQLQVRPLDGATLPTSLSDVSLVIDDVTYGTCSAIAQPGFFITLLDLAIAAQSRLVLNASSAGEPMGVQLNMPNAAVYGGMVRPVSISAATSDGTVPLPSGPVEVEVDSSTPVSVSAPADWVGDGVTASTVRATATARVRAGVALNCVATAALSGD